MYIIRLHYGPVLTTRIVNTLRIMASWHPHELTRTRIEYPEASPQRGDQPQRRKARHLLLVPPIVGHGPSGTA